MLLFCKEHSRMINLNKVQLIILPKISRFIIVVVGSAHSSDFPKMVPLHTVQYILYFHIYSQCSFAEDAVKEKNTEPGN
jgi:hypothetical protein